MQADNPVFLLCLFFEFPKSCPSLTVECILNELLADTTKWGCHFADYGGIWRVLVFWLVGKESGLYGPEG